MSRRAAYPSRGLNWCILLDLLALMGVLVFDLSAGVQALVAIFRLVLVCYVAYSLYSLWSSVLGSVMIYQAFPSSVKVFFAAVFTHTATCVTFSAYSMIIAADDDTTFADRWKRTFFHGTYAIHMLAAVLYYYYAQALFVELEAKRIEKLERREGRD